MIPSTLLIFGLLCGDWHHGRRRWPIAMISPLSYELRYVDYGYRVTAFSRSDSTHDPHTARAREHGGAIP